MTLEPRVPNTGDHRALARLADRLTEAGFDATVDAGPAFPALFVLIPRTRTLREMVLVSSGEFAWDAGQARCLIDDPSGAAAVLTRHINDLADIFAH